MGIERLDYNGVVINGKAKTSPFYHFEEFFDGSHRWLWNEFIRNPEAMAEYFNEGRYPFGNYGKDGNQYSGGVVHDIRNIENFYIKLDYAKRALILAWDARFVYEDFYRWFVKFFESYRHIYEKALPQFYQKNKDGYAPYHEVAHWMAKVLASTFVKYGPNAFLSLAAGIITMIKVDNEWLEAVKELVKKYPELQKFYEIQQMVGEELKINDDLYFSYEEIFDKWLKKYRPKDKLARGRMELANLLHGFIKAKNYLRAGSDSGVVLFRSVVDWINRERDEYIPPQEAFKEFNWAMQYLHGYTGKIGPVDDITWKRHCGHVTWKYLREKYRPTRDLNIGGL